MLQDLFLQDQQGRQVLAAILPVPQVMLDLPVPLAGQAQWAYKACKVLQVSKVLPVLPVPKVHKAKLDQVAGPPVPQARQAPLDILVHKAI